MGARALIQGGDLLSKQLGVLYSVALCVLTGAGAWADVYINEVDSNQTAADSGEFVELYDGGAGETSLDGLLLVFFNGESDTSYRVVDLTGESTDASGYFVVGNAGVTPRPGSILPDNTIQNGADAVALYDASEFSVTPGVPAPVTTQGLISAVVYGNSSADDSGLLVLLDPGQPQLDEHESGSSNEHSLQRCASNASGPLQTAGFGAALPTPWAENNCPQDPAAVVINELDSNQAGADGREFVELYDGGAGKTPLDGLVLVFFNGAVNTTYFSLDLDGTATDAQGYFLAGSFDVGPDIVLADGTIQNGADAVALYAGDAADFPAGTAVTTAGLRDAIVYTAGSAEDTPLLALVGGIGPILEEGAGGDADLLSLQRCPNGEGVPLSLAPFGTSAPTPRAQNTCANGLPVAKFVSTPLQTFAGSPVVFSDLSTGVVDSWQWSFEGGTPSASASETPEAVVFDTPGEKVVSLLVSGPGGEDVLTQTIEVRSPAPSVVGVALSDTNPAPCETVVFSAVDPGGQPPLTYTWSVSNELGQEVLTGSGSSLAWEVDADIAAESYTASLTISNALSDVTVESAPFNIANERPVIELSTPNPSVTKLPQAAIDIAVDAEDATTGLGPEDLLLTNATVLGFLGADNLYTAVITFVAEGPSSVQVREGAGAIRCGIPSLASNVLNFTYDATGPNAALSSEAPEIFTAPGFFVDVTFEEPVTGLEESDFTITNGVVGNLTGSGDTYELTVVPSLPGLVRVSVEAGAAEDAAKNASKAATPLTRAYLTNEALFTHSADSNENGVISLTEILRVVQLYNAGEFHCDGGTEDGFALGAGDRECASHSLDYVSQDWSFSLSELLRVVQMYAAGGYYACAEPESEDGFCLGAFTGK